MRHVLRLVVLLALPLTLRGHDTWLVPDGFFLRANSAVRVRLATSEEFPTSDSPADVSRVARATLRTAAGTAEIRGIRAEGNYLVAEVAPGAAGHAIVVMETKPRVLVLDAKAFNEYIAAEQHQHVLDARAARGQTNSPGRERYRKITKSMLCVGEPRDSLYAQPEGLWLEIVPEQSPCRLKAGDGLAVRILFEGRPLAGTHVTAGYKGTKGHRYPVTVKTDTSGQAVLKFTRAGVWFIRAHHIVPTTQDREADWESAFSTLTFEVRP